MHGFTRKHLAGFLLASAAALGVAPGAYAARDGGLRHEFGDRSGPMGMEGPRGMQGLRGLGLTEAQRDQIFKIRNEQAPAFYEQMKKVRGAREELRRLSSADSFDEAKVREAANAQARAMADLAVLRAQTANRVRAVLTPEQRSRLDEMRDRRRERGPRG